MARGVAREKVCDDGPTTRGATHGQALPAELGLHRVELMAGRSTQSTLLGGDDVTYESLYLTKDLVAGLDEAPQELVNRAYKLRPLQMALSSN